MASGSQVVHVSRISDILIDPQDLSDQSIHGMNPLGLVQDLNLGQSSLSADLLGSTSSMMEKDEAGLPFRSPKKRNRDMEIDGNISNDNV